MITDEDKYEQMYEDYEWYIQDFLQDELENIEKELEKEYNLYGLKIIVNDLEYMDIDIKVGSQDSEFIMDTLGVKDPIIKIHDFSIDPTGYGVEVFVNYYFYDEELDALEREILHERLKELDKEVLEKFEELLEKVEDEVKERLRPYTFEAFSERWEDEYR